MPETVVSQITQQIDESQIMGELRFHLLAEEVLRRREMPGIFPYRRAFLLGFVEGLKQNINIT